MLLVEHLNSGLAELSIAASERQRDQLLDYIQLLAKWNRVYNLTSVRDPGQMITRHILDSLVVLPYVKGPAVLDVGTGAGLPGIPLAVMLPMAQFVLLDSKSKKTRFLNQAIAELGLDNVEIATSLVEDFRYPGGFNTIVARAFTSLINMVTMTRHLLAPDGVILAMKGVEPIAELAELTGEVQMQGCHRLTVPALDAERHLVELKLKAE